MKHTRILLTILLLLSGRLSAQIAQCDTMTLLYVSSGIEFKDNIFSGSDSVLTIPLINHADTYFAYPQARLENTTPLPPGTALVSTGWVVFASAWNKGDTATANIEYDVNTPIPDNYTVTFKVYVTNFAPLAVDSCVFVNTFTKNLKPTGPIGIEQVNAPNSFSFYPNPAKDRIAVSAANETSLEIYTITGAVVQTAAISKQAINVNISALPAGVYFLREKGSATVQKLIKTD